MPDVRPWGIWVKEHRKQLLIYGGGGLVGLLLLVQIFYPGDRLLPFARVDGMQLGTASKTEAITRLNTAYAAHPIEIYLGEDKKPVVSPTLSEMKLSVDNTARVNKMTYPWYIRLVPSSLFWYQLSAPQVTRPAYAQDFDAYVETALMPRCKVAPINATLKVADNKLGVVASVQGNECDKVDVLKALKNIAPTISRPTTVHVAADKIAAPVTDAMAKDKADELNVRLKNGIDMMLDDTVIATAPMSDVMSWLDVTAPTDTLLVSVNGDRATAWLAKEVAPKVAVVAGTSRITTIDFTETSRINGNDGRALAQPETVASLQSVIDGQIQQAIAMTKQVPPTEVYTRSYSPTDAGLNALLANYAHDHPGTFGVSFIEMDGKKRRAEFQGDKLFVTASTYKLFAAYELLKQIDAGTRSWDAESTCFNKMITYSDNTCAEAYLNSLGLSTITKDIQAIGLKNSTFMKSGGPFTTANDLTLLVGMLQSQQNFSPLNRQRLINAMTANVYRKGIPAGVNGTVADKVGFIDNLLHDAAIVYGPKGTYVLAIMTTDSSWATIADFAKQIDTLHAQ